MGQGFSYGIICGIQMAYCFKDIGRGSFMMQLTALKKNLNMF